MIQGRRVGMSMNEFELERAQPRAEVASNLRKLADGEEQDSKQTFIAGEQRATIDPPEQMHFEMATTADRSWIGGDDGRSVHLAPGWEADEVESDDELTIVNRSGSHRPTEEVV